MDTAVIVGGALRTANGGLVLMDSGANGLYGVEFEGEMTVDGGVSVSMADGLVNNGTILVNGTGAAATTTLTATGPQILSGSGTVRLNGSGAFARLTGSTLTHAADHTIAGRGSITAPVINNGLIRADVAGQEIAVTSPTVANNSLMEATNGATLSLNSAVSQSAPGLVTAADGSTVEVEGGSISGGTLSAAGTGQVLLNGTVTLSGVDLEGAANIPAARTLILLDGNTVDGALLVNMTGSAATTTVTVGGLGIVGGAGSITLNAAGSFARLNASVGVPQIELSPSLTLRGRGSVQSPTVIAGGLEPGVGGLGIMAATAPVTLQGSTVTSIEVAGNDNSDRMDSSSTFAADGTLQVGFTGGFNPPLRWSTVMVNATGGVSGAFDTIIAPVPTDPRLTFRVIYNATNIRIGAYCKADFNFDNALNFFDVSGFLALYNAQDPMADMNNDMAWNFFDVSMFLSLYNSGCP